MKAGVLIVLQFILSYKDAKSPIFTLQHEKTKNFLSSLGNGDVDLRQLSDRSAIEWMLIQQTIGKSDPPFRYVMLKVIGILADKFSIVLAEDRFQALSCRTGEHNYVRNLVSNCFASDAKLLIDALPVHIGCDAARRIYANVELASGRCDFELSWSLKIL